MSMFDWIQWAAFVGAVLCAAVMWYQARQAMDRAELLRVDLIATESQLEVAQAKWRSAMAQLGKARAKQMAAEERLRKRCGAKRYTAKPYPWPNPRAAAEAGK
jgi:uncharacterized membrane protein (DUF106 family)